MPSLAYMLEYCNSSSIVVVDTDEKDHFLYFFHVFAGFIQVWPHFRPVIIVDGTFMKETYHGLLLSAYSMDTNEQIFPLILELDPQRVMIHGSFSSQS